MSLIDSLRNLYKVDCQVRGLRSRMESAERYHRTQCRLYDELAQQRDETQNRIKHLRATIGNLEAEVKTIDVRIEKLRGELNNASTNKQYTAVLNELNTIKTERSGIEDRVLSELDQVETLEKEIASLDEQMAERAKVRELARLQYDEREAEIGERLAELERERSVAASAVPPEALNVFEKVAETSDGDAMAPVSEIDRRNRFYACSACNIQIPFNTVAVLTAGGDSLVTCSSCGRILYLQEELRVAGAKK